jgi:hypothetical protein
MQGKVKALVWTRIGMEYQAALTTAANEPTFHSKDSSVAFGGANQSVNGGAKK